MHRDSHWRSKLPVFLVALFLLNLVILLALELLLVYRLPAPLTEEALADWDVSYEGCTILDSDSRSHFRCYLVKTASGELRIVPAESHSLLPGRARILKNSVTAVAESEEPQEITLRIGIRSTVVNVSPIPMPDPEDKSGDWYLTIFYHGAGSYQAKTMLYTLAAAVLEALELMLWELLKRGLS